MTEEKKENESMESKAKVRDGVPVPESLPFKNFGVQFGRRPAVFFISAAPIDYKISRAKFTPGPDGYQPPEKSVKLNIYIGKSGQPIKFDFASEIQIGVEIPKGQRVRAAIVPDENLPKVLNGDMEFFLE